MVLHPTSTQPLRGLPVAVLDFETTGTDPREAHPVQVAVATIDALGDSEPELAFSSLVRPPCTIPPESTEIHGITNDAVSSAPALDDLLPKLLEVLEGRALCAYNLPYDWTILARFAPGIPFGSIDPLVMVMEIDRYESSKKLSDAAARRGLALENAHDAGADVLMTARLLPVLLRELARGVTRKTPWGKTKAYGPWCRPEHVQTLAGLWHWTRVAGRAQNAGFALHKLSKEGEDVTDLPWLSPMEAA